MLYYSEYGFKTLQFTGQNGVGDFLKDVSEFKNTDYVFALGYQQ